LSREEEGILAGEEGEAKRLALTIIVKVGEALGADRLIPIVHAHVSGASYSTVGDAGRSFIEDLASMGARFSVPTTVNPVGFDIDDPGLIPYTSISRDYVRGQMAIINSFRKMGADLILTCTPYYADIPSRYGFSVGSHVAWGESSAVVYGNSFLGVRTNREGGPLALMAGIVGRTYYYGLHTSEGRKPGLEIIVDYGKPLDEAEAGIVGELVARYTPPGIVPVVRASIGSEPGLREFAAAVGTAGSIGMVHIPGVTPEKTDYSGIGDRILIDSNDIKSRLEELMPTRIPDIIFIGCPHAGLRDLELIERILTGKRLKTRVIVSLSRHVYMKALSTGLIGRLARMGIEFLRDTCLIVSPFKSPSVTVATNSFKAYFYLRRKGVNTYLASIDKLLQTAIVGG